MNKPYIAKHRHARISASKVRGVVNLIRGKSVGNALDILKYTNKRATPMIRKVLKSAVANAQDQDDLEMEDLYVSEARVDEGATFKRFRARAMGRASPIRRRTSHIIIGVTALKEE
jgi:large subunit ribosomal protein L22